MDNLPATLDNINLASDACAIYWLALVGMRSPFLPDLAWRMPGFRTRMRQRGVLVDEWAVPEHQHRPCVVKFNEGGRDPRFPVGPQRSQSTP